MGEELRVVKGKGKYHRANPWKTTNEDLPAV